MALNVSKTLLKAKSLARKGDVDAAMQLFTAVLEQYPQNKEAVTGLASLKQTRPPAIRGSIQSLQEDLQTLVSLFNQGDLQRVLELGQILAYRYPEQPLVHNVVGAAHKSLRNYDSAIESLTRAIRLQPDYAEAYNNLGAACHDIGLYEEAIANYTQATTHDPDFFEAWNNLGNVLTEAGRSEEAIASFRQAIRIKPDFSMAFASLVFQLAQVCDWDALRVHAAAIAQLGLHNKQVFPFSLLPNADNPAHHRQRSELYARNTFQTHQLPAITRPDGPPRRLRIGYFSAEFRDHATMYLMARLFELHDRDRFAIHAYSYGRVASDSMRRRIEAAVDAFHDVHHLTDREIAELCRSHEIDIAVDLKGYTQFSRLGIFSYRIAPVQISYLGYPGTTGASFMDYVIADEVVIPEDQRIHYSEQIIYLPHSYQVNDGERTISEKVPSRLEAGLPEEEFVFCCFNNNFKIGPREFDIWMRLLQQVNGSVLWLFSSSKTAEANLRQQAALRDVDPSRVVFAEKIPHAEHLARHRLADLFLDTFNYNAHTTASDALWTGLPLVTKAGEGFAARVAASLLRAIELPELITTSESEYERLALDLALHPQRLIALREKLAANRLTTPLFNTALFTQHIESAYQQAYQHYFAGEPPGTILVQPGNTQA